MESAAEFALLASVSWPAWRPCLSADFWRAFPTLAARLLAVVSLYLIAVGAIAVLAPATWLRVLAIAAAVVFLAIHWHARVAYGRGSRWAPGALAPLALGPWFDRDFFLDQARRHGPVFKTCHFTRPMTCLVGLGDGLDFIKTNDASLANPPMPFGRFIPGGFLRHMPRDRHATAKDALQRALSRDVYEPLEPFIRERFRQAAAGMVDASSATPGGIPPRRHFQRALFPIWARLFFGIASEAGGARLKALYHLIDVRNPSGASDTNVRDAVAEIRRMVDAQLQPLWADGQPSSFFGALQRRAPDRVSDANVVTNLIYLMHTSWADVSGLLGWLFRMMTEHPDWTDRLRQTDATSDVTGPSSLPLRFVMETLRLEQSEHLYRVTTQSVEHKGFVIPSGWMVRLCVRESHRDPAVFEEPHQFNPDRFLWQTFTRREYSPFGSGHTYACLGEGLTLLVGRLFVQEFARAATWTTVADGPYEYSAWRHWRPSSNWRVRVLPLS